MQNFEIINIDKESFENCEMVLFTLKTKKGTADFAEYIDEDGSILKGADSHIRTNQVDDLSELFDMSGKPSLMPAADFLSDEIQAILKEVGAVCNKGAAK